jgi:signal peptidase I
LLALILSGLGQLYAGEPWRALAVYLGSVALLSAALFSALPKTFPGLIVFVLAEMSYRLWSMWDSARIARRKQDYVLKPFNRWYWYLAAVLILNVFIGPRFNDLSPLGTFKITSRSMEPAVLLGDHLCADVTFYRSFKPSRGDLVLFVPPEDPKIQILKRVIGLPGERIEIRDKAVYIDGRRLEDPWGHSGKAPSEPGAPASPGLRNLDNLPAVEIPAGHVFLIGDDRDHSYDSRFYGPVPLSSLRGRALYVYWSPDWSRIGRSLR